MIPRNKTTVRRQKDSRIEAVIARSAAQFIAREAGNESLITVIRAQSLAHGERMEVFVSVFPVEKTRAAFTFLERQREAFSDYLKENTNLSSLPRIDFMLDYDEHSLPEASAR